MNTEQATKLIARFELMLERMNAAYADPYADAEDRGDAKANLREARAAIISAVQAQEDALRRLHDWVLAQEGDCTFSGDHPIAQAAAELAHHPLKTVNREASPMCSERNEKERYDPLFP